MKRTLITLSWLLLLIVGVACGGADVETAVPDQPLEDASETDTKTVSAKPQLIEFYADW